MSKYIIAVLFSLLLFSHGQNPAADSKTDLLRDTLIIDVRNPHEYEAGHIEGAVNVPLYELERRIREVVPDYNEEFIIYCYSGRRSDRAKKILESLGYKNIIDGGAIEDLREAKKRKP